MPAKSGSLLGVAVTLLLDSIIPTAVAHDLAGLVAERTAMEPDVRAKLDEVNELRRMLAVRVEAAPQDTQIEAVVQRALRWPVAAISVCFFDGQREARDHVADVAQRWEAMTSLKFDFGPRGNRSTCDLANPSNVRVSFRGIGYWSYIGTQAKRINAFKQTLNLQGMDKTSFTTDDDGIILHEFGHSVGFEHEHQSPVSGCSQEFDWDYLYTALGWSKEEVDRNMRKLDLPSSATGLLTTAFDRDSIMLYSLDRGAFKHPASATCYIPRPNHEISKMDREAAITVYPPMGATQQPPAAAPVDDTSPGAAATILTIRRLRELVQ
jgi:hypothetical protein